MARNLGQAIPAALSAIQGVQAISGNIERMQRERELFERQTQDYQRTEKLRQEKEAWLTEWVDPKTRPFYIKQNDDPEMQGYLDSLFAPSLNEQGLIQRKNIVSAFKNAKNNMEALDSLRKDVIPAKRRRSAKLWEEAQTSLEKFGKFSPQYKDKINKHNALEKMIGIMTGDIAKQERKLEQIEAQKVGKGKKEFAPKEMIYQDDKGTYRAGLFDSQGKLIRNLRKATEKEISGTKVGAKETPEHKRALGFVNQLFDFAEINANEKADLMNRISKSDKPLDIMNSLFNVAKKQNRKGLISRIKEWFVGEKEPSPVVVTDRDVDGFITRNKLADTPTNRDKIREKLREAK